MQRVLLNVSDNEGTKEKKKENTRENAKSYDLFFSTYYPYMLLEGGKCCLIRRVPARRLACYSTRALSMEVLFFFLVSHLTLHVLERCAFAYAHLKINNNNNNTKQALTTAHLLCAMVVCQRRGKQLVHLRRLARAQSKKTFCFHSSSLIELTRQ